MLFGKRLRELRESRGLSQTELAKIFKLSKQTISSYENDGSAPGPETMAGLADYFDVSLDYLLGRDEYIKLAANRTGDPMDDLPPEALEEVERFVEFIRHKYKEEKDG